MNSQVRWIPITNAILLYSLYMNTINKTIIQMYRVTIEIEAHN